MSALSEHLDRYLALRRALGYKLDGHGRHLASFVAYLDELDQQTLTVHAALSWASKTGGESQVASRLSMVRGFATYLSGFDPGTEVPPARLVASGVSRVRPYLFSNRQIRVLMRAARALGPKQWGETMATLLGLLAATGLRPGEAYRLERSHVDLAGHQLAVMCSKDDKSRLLPLHASTVAALRRYAKRRDQLARRAEHAFFLSPTGRGGIASGHAAAAFRELLCATAIAAPPGRRPPRLYDLRHSFAVQTLIDWHRAGIDVQRQLPVLSAYLGHLVPANTYWYLEAAPELLAIVAKRLSPCFEGLS